MLTVQDELKRLAALQERAAAVASALERHRADVSKCNADIGDIRAAAALDPEENPTRTVEASCKKLELQRAAAYAEIERLTPEQAPLQREIEKIENGIGARVHIQKLEKQTQIRAAYRAIAARLLEAVNDLSRLSYEARAMLFAAGQDFPLEEHHPTSDGIVLRSAGLRPVWDQTWIGFPGDRTRREVVVEKIFDYDRTLVDPNDPVAIQCRHSEDFFRRRAAQYAEQHRMTHNPTPDDFERDAAAALARGETPGKEIHHPLSHKGLLHQFGRRLSSE